MTTSPNIGHKDSPEFQAIEARWKAEKDAAFARFWQCFKYLGRLADQDRGAELDRYETQFGALARLTMEDYIAWNLAGRPRDNWTPPRLASAPPTHAR
jgi:hypothetical protein